MWFFSRKKKITTVFFDIGGVVVDAPTSHYLDLGAEIYGCTQETLHREASQLVPALERGQVETEEFWERLGQNLKAAGVKHDVPAWRFKGFWEGVLMDHFKIDQEILKLARRLKSNFTVAALSNTIQEHALALKREGLYDHFNPVILSCQVGARKPDKEIFERAAKLTDSKPTQCLLIDDLEENVEGAIQAGYQAHLFTGREPLVLELQNLNLL